MAFSADIKGCMRDCILSLLWARKDIYSFFENNGCTKSDLKTIANYKQQTRLSIVNTMFDHLSGKVDNGLGIFRAMLKSLTEWSHFDPYYFDQIQKLDREQATKNIEHLKQLVEIRDAKIKAERAKKEQLNQTQQQARQTLQQLKNSFLNFYKDKNYAQKRGYELEKIIYDLSRLSALEVTESFRVNGEQIDGAVKHEGNYYLLEAKWQDKASSNEPVYQFVGKVEGKMYGRGIFISINGFSDFVVKSITEGKAIKTIFIDGEDLVLVLEEHLSFSQLIDKKVKAAQTRGEIYINPLSEKSKLNFNI